MSGYDALVDVLAALVHDSYVRDKRADGVTSLPSRRGTGDLMRPFDELDETDKQDDRRTVHAVLEGLTNLPWVQVCDLLIGWREDRALPAELRAADGMCDPPPAGLADRMVRVVDVEDGQQ